MKSPPSERGSKSSRSSTAKSEHSKDGSSGWSGSVLVLAEVCRLCLAAPLTGRCPSCPAWPCCSLCWLRCSCTTSPCATSSSPGVSIHLPQQLCLGQESVCLAEVILGGCGKPPHPPQPERVRSRALSGRTAAGSGVCRTCWAVCLCGNKDAAWSRGC